MNKRIILMATGGTISSTGAADNTHLKAELRGAQLKDRLAGLAEIEYEIEVVDVSVVNSTAITPGDMIELARAVNVYLDKDDVVGVVITHGTSLMEETAFMLDMLVTNTKKPVVITGAQRNATYPWPDGIANLNDALHIAASPLSENMGVMVVFSGKIFEGFCVKKVHTCALEGFSADEHGQLGSIFYNKVFFLRNRIDKPKIPLDNMTICSVPIIPFYSGADARYIYHAIDSGENGIVVEGVGLGNVNSTFYNGIKAAREKGLPVVVTSRSSNGVLIPLYSYKGGGISLKELGVIFTSYGSVQARLMLLLLLGAKFDYERMAEFFE
ncbi:MAG: asparaginase [Clostridia bacterium]|nr:asparaginase [Clostridia bacterium]